MGLLNCRLPCDGAVVLTMAVLQMEASRLRAPPTMPMRFTQCMPRTACPQMTKLRFFACRWRTIPRRARWARRKSPESSPTSGGCTLIALGFFVAAFCGFPCGCEQLPFGACMHVPVRVCLPPYGHSAQLPAAAASGAVTRVVSLRCRKAARNAKAAGFDGVEVHGANGGCCVGWLAGTRY